MKQNMRGFLENGRVKDVASTRPDLYISVVTTYKLEVPNYTCKNTVSTGRG